MDRRKSNKLTTGRLIASLGSMKNLFSAEHDQEKVLLIRELSLRQLKSPSVLKKYHDILCFMQAYPGNTELLTIIDEELSGFTRRIETYRKIYGLDDDRLDDTGMVDTVIGYPYNYITAQWLVRNFGRDVDIDWNSYAEKESDPISGLLSLFALYLENDGIDDENISSEDWLDEARGDRLNSLAWLLGKIDSLNAPLSVKQYIYDSAELDLRWILGRSNATTTLAKKAMKNIFFHRTSLVKTKIDLRKSAGKSIPDLDLISAEDGEETINTLIKALLPRHRELYPATFANLSEVYETSPGRGLQIYILGMRPDDRMPLETNYSALLIKNGVPIGYGIAVLFFDRCEIAINVFDSFRSAEASMIFDHFLRVFYHHFGARTFIMRRWQVGFENEEGLKSGSFWFYYKMGFRPMDKRIDGIARIEARRIKHDPAYRTDLKTLKKLATSDMLVDLRTRPRGTFRELQVTDIGIAVTRWVAKDYAGNSRRAQESAQKRAAIILGDPDQSGWNRSERLQFARWSPLIAIIPEMNSWSHSEIEMLLEIIRAKAGVVEKEYVRLLQNHPRLESSLSLVARRGSH